MNELDCVLLIASHFVSDGFSKTVFPGTFLSAFAVDQQIQSALAVSEAALVSVPEVFCGLAVADARPGAFC